MEMRTAVNISTMKKSKLKKSELIGVYANLVGIKRVIDKRLDEIAIENIKQMEEK